MLSDILKDILNEYSHSEEYVKSLFLNVKYYTFEKNFMNTEIADKYGLYVLKGDIDNVKLSENLKGKKLKVINNLCGIGDAGYLQYIDRKIKYKIISSKLKLDEKNPVHLKSDYILDDNVDISVYKENNFVYSYRDNLDGLYPYIKAGLKNLELIDSKFVYTREINLNILNYDNAYQYIDKQIQIFNYLNTRCISRIKAYELKASIYADKIYKEYTKFDDRLECLKKDYVAFLNNVCNLNVKSSNVNLYLNVYFRYELNYDQLLYLYQSCLPYFNRMREQGFERVNLIVKCEKKYFYCKTYIMKHYKGVSIYEYKTNDIIKTTKDKTGTDFEEVFKALKRLSK